MEFLDGLLLGGAPVVSKLLVKALIEADAGPSFAAAFVLLSGQSSSGLHSVLQAMEDAKPETSLIYGTSWARKDCTT